MTREEAVSLIEERIRVTEYVESSYVDCVDIEALRMAIKALEQPEIVRCKDCKYNTGDYKCLNPDSFFVVPADDDFCSFAESRKVSERRGRYSGNKG